MNNPFGTIYSLDFETTSLDPNDYILRSNDGGPNIRGRIWSIGIHEYYFGEGESSKEATFRHADDEIERVEREILLRDSFRSNESNDYYKYATDQKEGALRYTHSGTNSEQLSFLNDEFENKRSGMILVQNLQFERRFIDSIDGNANSSIISNMFEQATGTSNTKLYTPSGVTNAKNELANTKNAKEADAVYDNIIKAYMDADRAVKSSTESKFYAADLMDFTRATWVKAAAKGYLPESAANTATSMEFLARLLLGEEEIHGAASDARQQVHVFNKLMNIHSELSSDNLSNETLKILKDVSTINGTLRERQSAKSLISNIEKLRAGGRLDAREQIGSYNISVRDTVSDELKVVSSARYADSGSDEASLSRLNKIIHQNYSGTLAAEEFSRLQELHKYNTRDILMAMQNGDFLDKIRIIEQYNSEIIDKYLSGAAQRAAMTEREKEAIRLNNLAEKGLPNRADTDNASYIAKKYNEIRSNSRILKDLLPEDHVKGIFGSAAVIAGGLFYAMSDSADDDLRVRKIKENQERLDMMQYNDPTFRQFSSLDYAAMPAGVGRANRESYNRSYEY